MASGELTVRSVGIIGLGVVGGSVARALSARGIRVLGHDRDAATLLAARLAGVVHGTLDAGLAGLAEAEVVILAVPVAAASGVLEAARPHLAGARLVTDVGSTKGAIVASAERLGLGERFVGAHPMAGDHRAGWAASRPDLFEGARVYLSPTTCTAETALRTATALWTELGGVPERIDAAEHDRLLAWSSHLPQATATALALALRGTGVRRDALGPGGRDTTRLAASSPEMWTGIALENAEPLDDALAALEARIAELRASLRARDPAALAAYFDAAREWCAGTDESF